MDLNQSDITEKSSLKGAWTFSFPHEVVDDPSLGFDQKRAILAQWASDACAVESLPTLRLLPGTTFPVTYSSIMDARARLEGLAPHNDDDDADFCAPQHGRLKRMGPIHRGLSVQTRR